MTRMDSTKTVWTSECGMLALIGGWHCVLKSGAFASCCAVAAAPILPQHSAGATAAHCIQGRRCRLACKAGSQVRWPFTGTEGKLKHVAPSNAARRDGFDRFNLDKDGFSPAGVDKYGFNRSGYDKEGYDVNGFNKDGFDVAGFNKSGFDK
jgi:hypothetical protein